MNLKIAKDLPLGALVRPAFHTETKHYGIVLAKEHVKEHHTAKQLGGEKEERYDITVHWIGGVFSYFKDGSAERRPIVKHQNWELMIYKPSTID